MYRDIPQGGGGEVDGSPGIVLGLPQLLWCTGILCHRGGGGEVDGWLSRDTQVGLVDGSPGIVVGLPQ